MISSELMNIDIEEAPHMKILQPIGGVFDIISGDYILGHANNWVLNGGFPLTGGMAIVGSGNSFKSTLLHGLTLASMSLTLESTYTNILTYDTETNIQQAHLHTFTQQHKNLKGEDILFDKRTMMGNTFYKSVQNYVKQKIKHKKKLMVTTPYFAEDGKSIYKQIAHTYMGIDSFTDFETDDVQDIHDKIELGDSKGRMVFMNQGLSKYRLLSSLPKLIADGSIYMGMTAHVGKENAVSAGPSHLPPPKAMNTMKAGDKIKGVTERFFFSLGLVYQCGRVAVKLAPDKSPLYPFDKVEQHTESADLNEVTLKVLRSKSSQSGLMFKVMVSQRQGLLLPLTNFHICKDDGKFGFFGNDVSYCCEFMPTLTLRRTTIRKHLDENPLLVRAVEINCDLYYITKLRKMPDLSVPPTPKELYEGLKEMGYCWDKILSTRGRHVINEEYCKIIAVSTMDLIYELKGKGRFKQLMVDSKQTIEQKKVKK